MSETELVQGELQITGLLEGLCIESAEALVRLLPSLLTPMVPATISNVVVGSQQPGDDRRNNLWIRLDNSGDFVGIYVYAVGQWRQVYPVPGQLFYISGDSRDIPKGFKLATAADSGLPTSQKNFLKTFQHWHDDVVDSYYDLFYVLYVGF